MTYIWLIVLTLAVIYLFWTVGNLMETVKSLTEALSSVTDFVNKQSARIVVLEKIVNKEITFSLSESKEEKPAKKTTTKKKTTKKDAAA